MYSLYLIYNSTNLILYLIGLIITTTSYLISQNSFIIVIFDYRFCRFGIGYRYNTRPGIRSFVIQLYKKCSIFTLIYLLEKLYNRAEKTLSYKLCIKSNSSYKVHSTACAS